jgi:hypothetical protein
MGPDIIYLLFQGAYEQHNLQNESASIGIGFEKELKVIKIFVFT